MFRSYAALHKKKNTHSADLKAEANRREAELLEAALASPVAGGEWRPTAEGVKSLPPLVRDYVLDLERACDEVMGERDRYSDALANAHVALGGDGEWVAKMPGEHPPHSGDLALDVPALASEITAPTQPVEPNVRTGPSGAEPNSVMHAAYESAMLTAGINRAARERIKEMAAVFPDPSGSK